MARPPQPRARVGVALVDDLGRALLVGDRLDELEVGVDELLAAGRLDEEARPLGIRRARVGVGGGHEPRVEELDPRHAGARGDDRGGRPAGALDVGERDPQRDRMLGDRVEPDRHLGDHGERPLRADEQPGEVVARGRLGGAGAGADDRGRRPAPPRARARWRASCRSERSSCRPRSSPPCRRASRRRRGRRGRRGRARRRRASAQGG